VVVLVGLSYFVCFIQLFVWLKVFVCMCVRKGVREAVGVFFNFVLSSLFWFGFSLLLVCLYYDGYIFKIFELYGLILFRV